MLATQQKGYVLASVSVLWLGLILFFIASNVILRETWLGGIAKALDALPSSVQSIVFVLLWALFFLGWIVPAFLAVRDLKPAPKSDQKESPTTNDRRRTTVL